MSFWSREARSARRSICTSSCRQEARAVALTAVVAQCAEAWKSSWSSCSCPSGVQALLQVTAGATGDARTQ